MVTHIVMWKLKDGETKEGAGQEMKKRLEGLAGQVPGMLDAQVHIGFSGYDLALVSHHGSRADLEVYQSHPAHMKVKEYVHAVIAERASCDFED